MNYSDAKSLIKSGDILAFSHVGWRNWHDIKVNLVRIFTMSEYSHVATAYIKNGDLFVIEAVMPVVKLTPLFSMGDFYWISMGLPWKQETEKYALSKLGEKYSEWQAIESLFDQPPKDNLWECAELVKAIAGADGFALESKPTPSKIVKELQLKGKDLKFVKSSI